jgi:hypothetical protein
LIRISNDKLVRILNPDRQDARGEGGIHDPVIGPSKLAGLAPADLSSLWTAVRMSLAFEHAWVTLSPAPDGIGTLSSRSAVRRNGDRRCNEGPLA